MGRDRLCGSCGTKVLHRQIFIIGYQQVVDRKHLHSTLLNSVRNFNSGRTATQVAVREWYRNFTKQWLREATWNLVRRWSCCVT
jgi:hypothetical protein